MSHDDLTSLLVKLRDTPASADLVTAARDALVGTWEGDVRALFVDDVAGDAAMLLDVLTHTATPWLAPVLQQEDRDADVADDVMAALFGAPTSSVRDAVVFEAGAAPEASAPWATADADVAMAVQVEAGRVPDLAKGFDPQALPVAEAVAAEAGTIDIAASVQARIAQDQQLPEGWLSGLLDHALTAEQRARAVAALSHDAQARAEMAQMADLGRHVREAVQQGAGRFEGVWGGVAEAIGLDDADAVPGWDETLVATALAAEAGTIEIASDVMAAVRRDVRAPSTDLPEPVNDNQAFPWKVVLLAALALVVIVPRLMPVGQTPDFVAKPIAFASSDEIHVDRIAYGENASVFVEVPESDDDPIIIWVDDGGDL